MEKVKTSTLLRCLLILFIALLVAIGAGEKTSLGMSLWSYTKIASLATLVSPNDAALQLAIGNYYFGGGAYNTEKAEKHYREALELDQQLQGPHYQIARIYFVRGDFYPALKEINRELELHPDFKRSYYVRGLIYGYSDMLSEAEADFIEFLKWKPDSWAGNNDLAWIYFQGGKYKEAAEAARAGLKIAPDNAWLLNALGVALLNEGKLVEARKSLTAALVSANAMTLADWGGSYPGNNPSVYGDGLEAMKASIGRNLELIAAKNAKVDK
jgi:tetratricopeptide (TPR) repeat protein